MRLTHDQVVRFCNANLGHHEGFPLRLANETANIIYGDMIAMLESMIAELRRLQAEQAEWNGARDCKK